MLVGITGQIGAGKSEVARIFKKHGAFVISADNIGKDVVEKNKSVLNKLAKSFGKEILTPSGKLRRRKLGEMAFSSKQNKTILNNIVHPPLLKELERQSKSALKKYKIVIIDAALLIDWKWYRKVDYTILVNAGNKIKIKRLIKSGFSIKEAKMRLKSQLKYNLYKRHSDITILNNKSLVSLELKVKKILKRLVKRG